MNQRLGMNPLWIVGILVLLVALGLGGWAVARSDLPQELTLPILLVVAIIVAWFVLILFSLVFRAIGLDNPAQALGLPDGSIRAVVAMSLIVLFATVPLFLYGRMGKSAHADRLNDEEKSSLINNLAKGSYVPIQINQPALNALANGKQQPNSWTVYYSQDSPAQNDFAKQILTVLGTLVTSVVSFFFGAAVANSAATSTASAMNPSPSPALTGIRPSQFPLNQPSSFVLAGSNMNPVTAVTFTQGTQRISAASVSSNPTEVHGTVQAPAQASGTWDVETTTADGKIARLPGSVTFGP